MPRSLANNAAKKARIFYGIAFVTQFFHEDRRSIMVRAAIVFFVLALIAMLLGAYGVAGVSIEMGKLLLVTFLVLAGVSLVVGLVSGRSPTQLP